MTNFDRARNRIMYSQNLLDTYTISINKKQIKKNKTNKKWNNTISRHKKVG